MRRILLWLLSFFPEERDTIIIEPTLKNAPPSLYHRFTQPEEAPDLVMKGKLMELVREENWQWFEKYLSWKMGVATREIFGSEANRDDRYARDRRVEVGAWSEITMDMQQFWIDLQKEEGKTKEEKKQEEAEKPTFNPMIG